MVNGCSAACNFGVHAEEDELMSFYFTIMGEWGDQYATGEEQRNTSRRNEEASQSRNNTQFWMCLMMKVKSDAVKNNFA